MTAVGRALAVLALVLILVGCSVETGVGAAERPARPAVPFDLEGDGGFIPSGWMGDGMAGEPAVTVDRDWRDGPHSGESCERWTWTPGRDTVGWAAVGWQYPERNWGQVPGRDLRGGGYVRVSVWLRGLPDAEGRLPRLRFKAGGHTRPGAACPASFESAGRLETLTAGWRRYTLPLRGSLENVPCSFVWTADAAHNPSGVTFFLDDLRYE